MTTYLDLIAPDDFHIHLRDENALKTTVLHASRQFSRVLVMPNLKEPITTAPKAVAYLERIKAAIPIGSSFTPLMTLYLTDKTTKSDIKSCLTHQIKAVKLYPAGATTNSDSGVTSLEHCDTVLAFMEEVGLSLLLHGEVTDSNVDIFDREAVFIDKVLIPLRARYPQLKIVLEHITTKAAADYVMQSEDGIAATITAHHLLYNRNAMLVGGIRPHYYCLPILKRESHREALILAATSGNNRFFLGTDSAPHAVHTKEATCGCAGCYTAPYAMELYATAFEGAGALDKLEGFSSIYGAQFYGLPLNTKKIRLIKQNQTIAKDFHFLNDQKLIPLNAGEILGWQLTGIS